MAKANSTRRRLQALPADPPPAPPERPKAAPAALPHPLEDLEAAEAVVDLVRIGVANDFASNDGREARQESGAAALAHALYLIRSARLALADALAKSSHPGPTAAG